MGQKSIVDNFEDKMPEIFIILVQGICTAFIYDIKAPAMGWNTQ